MLCCKPVMAVSHLFDVLMGKLKCVSLDCRDGYADLDRTRFRKNCEN